MWQRVIYIKYSAAKFTVLSSKIVKYSINIVLDNKKYHDKQFKKQIQVLNNNAQQNV